ncbi:uncharacterized protein AMSG_03353 [Thecamonas trahens ATCC 50062]|uniref:Uncharacterized protein n=1 Tax=Thecamonas trahens ATCC 50062 TaxID=461836 RepID=A0A0L0D3L7_THETB|nr:hypothetical protein AMSG_03353 [Thecamonas trahens ATCC 50062]KNC46922.1 hypothetical protein AMSG_03353 [Thecamonas trahens ATCC 50062]|eukprot:XP_013760195.1 hypothetical protein AMSG_03353 [Thecamonas trahens ATCC 50062]
MPADSDELVWGDDEGPVSRRTRPWRYPFVELEYVHHLARPVGAQSKLGVTALVGGSGEVVEATMMEEFDSESESDASSSDSESMPDYYAAVHDDDAVQASRTGLKPMRCPVSRLRGTDGPKAILTTLAQWFYSTPEVAYREVALPTHVLVDSRRLRNRQSARSHPTLTERALSAAQERLDGLADSWRRLDKRNVRPRSQPVPVVLRRNLLAAPKMSAAMMSGALAPVEPGVVHLEWDPLEALGADVVPRNAPPGTHHIVAHARLGL